MQLKNDAILSLLGLAAKGGNVLSGGFQTETAVKSGRARLVIAARDASAGSLKKIRDMCSYYKVPLLLYGNREDLGACIGKALRTSVVLTDDGLAAAVLKKAGAGAPPAGAERRDARNGENESI